MKDHLTFNWSTVEPGISDLDDYKRSKRLIRIQERRAPNFGLAKRAVDGYGFNYRFLVVKANRAVFQCDEAIDAIEYSVEHRPGCNIIDLQTVTERDRRRLIGQYLAPRESVRQQTPILDRTTGKFTFGVHESLEKKRYQPGEVIPLRSIKESLKEPYERNARKIPPPVNCTPAEVIVKRFLNGQPLTPDYKCKSCGYSVCQCAPKRRERSEAPMGQPLGERKPRKQDFGLTKPSDDIFSASAILNDRLLGKITRAELWIQESL